jgi:hypothetical protein
LLALAIGGALVWLIATDPSNRLGYVKALVWPIVIIVVAFTVRDVLRERIGSMTKLSMPGSFIAEFAERQSNAELQQSLREASPVLVDDRDETRDGDDAQGDSTDTAVAVSTESERRAALERAVKAGAVWGFNMAAISDSPPEPVITWGGDGEPTIAGTWGVRRPTFAWQPFLDRYLNHHSLDRSGLAHLAAPLASVRHRNAEYDRLVADDAATDAQRAEAKAALDTATALMDHALAKEILMPLGRIKSH